MGVVKTERSMKQCSLLETLQASKAAEKQKLDYHEHLRVCFLQAVADSIYLWTARLVV